MIASGTEGTCQWIIDDDGVLTIGAGEIRHTSYLPIDWSWDSQRSQIIRINASAHITWASNANAYNMFRECYYLQSANLSGFDTSNVTNMSGMFASCYSLVSLDISNFDTSNVTSMYAMFNHCGNLVSLNISGFNTSNVTNMAMMFNNCEKLTFVDISSFNTSNVTGMYAMFDNCESLVSLDLKHFDTSNVTGSMADMFGNCRSLTFLDVSNFDTSNVSDMCRMFYNCCSLTSLDIRNFDTSNVTDMSSMFLQCQSLSSLLFDVNKFNTNKVTDIHSMFENCSSLTSLDVSHFNTSNVTGSMADMFYNCRFLTFLDVSNFDTSNVTNMYRMFYNCRSLTSLNVSNFDTSNVTDMSAMFDSCSGLVSLNVSGFNIINVKYMDYMFRNCSKLTYLELYVSNSNFTWNNIFTNTSGSIYIIKADGSDLLLHLVPDAWRTVAAAYSNVHYEADDLIVGCINQIYRCLVPNNLIGNGIHLISNILFESNGLLPQEWTFDVDINNSEIKINNISQTGGTWEKTSSNQWQYYKSKIETNNNDYTQDVNAKFICKDGDNIPKREITNITSSVTYEHPESLIYASFQDGDYLYYITDEINKKVTAFTHDKTKTSYSNLANEVVYDNQKYTLNELREYINGVPSKGCYEDCVNLVNLPSIANLTDITSLERCFQNCSSLQSFGTSSDFDIIPSRITNISNCFNGCSSLTGNINVLPIEIITFTSAFANTALPIYIVGGEVDPSDREKLEQTWRDIVGPYGNVHFEADDNQAPSLNINSLIRGKYEDNQWTDSDEATHIKGIISYSNFDNYLPVGWSKPILTKDNVKVYDQSSLEAVIWETDSDTIFYIPLTANPELNHEIRVEINDTFHTTSITRVVIGLFAMMDFVPGGKGMAIGSVATRNGLNITIPTAIGLDLQPATTYGKTNDTSILSYKVYYKLENGLYIKISESDEYVLTEDERVNPLTDYYKLENSHYSKVTPEEGDNPHSNGWYVRVRPIDAGWYEKDSRVDLSNYQLITGQYNSENKEAIFIVGNGERNYSRSNAVEICNGPTVKELTGGGYLKTEDIEIEEGKTYYKLEGGRYVVVSEPDDREIENYYEFVPEKIEIGPYFNFGQRAFGTKKGIYSFVEGINNEAIGPYSHVEGEENKANNLYSHAEGFGTEAYGKASHTQGIRTKAMSEAQTALGKRNSTDDAGTYALIIGNGSGIDESVRSNALAVTWDGDVHVYLKLNLDTIDDKLYQIAQTYPEAIISENTALGTATVSLKSLLYHALTWD